MLAARDREPTDPVTLVDLAVVAVLGLSVLFALWRGAIRETLALASWVIAFIAAKALAPMVALWLAPLPGSESMRIVAAWFLVFVTVLILGGIVGLLISSALHSIGLGTVDRMLGGIFGLARGLLIVTVLALIAGLTSLPETEAWEKARLRSHVEGLAVFARGLLPASLAKNISYQ